MPPSVLLYNQQQVLYFVILSNAIHRINQLLDADVHVTSF